MKATLFETEHCYTVIDDDGEYLVSVTHHCVNDTYDYEVDSLDGIILTGRKHDEVLSFVCNTVYCN